MGEVIATATRLKALRELTIDDDRVEDSLAAMVEKVAALYGMPLSMINLVYQDRQVIKWYFGAFPADLLSEGAPHESSFCTYVVEAGAPLVVGDLLDNEAWQDPFHWPAELIEFYSRIGVRFYAGVPLMGKGGEALGTLCLLDTEPREFSASQLESLQLFAAKASAELELASRGETSRRLRSELDATSAYATRLSNLMIELQGVSDPAALQDTALQRIREVSGMVWAALARLGEPLVVSGTMEGEAVGFAAATEAEYLQPGEALRKFGIAQCVAIVPMPDVRPSTLFVGKAGDSWSESDRFFLESAARIIASAIQRGSRELNLEKAAWTDGLTGLANRRAFEMLAAQPLQPGQRLTVFVGDVGGFKSLNDALGHPVGDVCLRRVGEALVGAVRHDDRPRVFRLGGDEFVIVISGEIDAEEFRLRLEKSVLSVFREYERIPLRMDVGFATVPGEAVGIEEAVRLADTRMYENKNARKGRDLSDRENQILSRILAGQTTKEIALELGIAETTVATHRSRLLKKMNLRDNRDLFCYALRHGLL